MPLDLDCYYTPEPVARLVLERACLERVPEVCADSTCGSGRLLDAANEVFGHVQCMGIDRDRRAIAELRRRNPSWILAVGDLLNNRLRRTFASIMPENVDLLILNPPFSLGNKKFVEISYDGHQLTGSVAMAHLLRSFELFAPREGAIAIVPESLLYSETDATARDMLSARHSLQKIADLQNSTFRGARAHASAVQITPNRRQEGKTDDARGYGHVIRTRIVRGGLQVHTMKESRLGTPFIHSVDIRTLVEQQDVSSLRITSNSAKGRVDGWMVLVPRVGKPAKELIQAVDVTETVQLSDCVIALQCTNKATATRLASRIKESWEDFCGIFRGTGAQYVTLLRLKEWLASRSIIEFID
ncbi:MAG: N-6 DNA methylase [Candidatus Accumulibacter necessarius]|jgi:hypothetical protein|uniref:N-6 DNA methylase n=1 Tax=Candidatus Accumulibacter necessarius TaxID=2954386 RepID=UPI002FC2D42A